MPFRIWYTICIIMSMKETVENNVYEVRAEMGITQEELGDLVGVTRQTIIAIEKGSYVPSVLLSLKIAKYFKKPVEKIFSIKK